MGSNVVEKHTIPQLQFQNYVVSNFHSVNFNSLVCSCILDILVMTEDKVVGYKPPQKDDELTWNRYDFL